MRTSLPTSKSTVPGLHELMSRNPVTIDREATLDDALARLEGYGFRHLPVVECNRVVGMLSDRDLRLATGLERSDVRLRNRHGLRLPGAERVREIMRRPVHCLPVHASALQATQDMLRLGIGAIPVLEDKCLVGIVTETDLLRVYLEICKRSSAADSSAQRYLHEPLPTVELEATIEEALDALDPRIGHLCVLADERIAGIVSERDLRVGLARSSQRDARLWSERRLDPTISRVRDFVTTRVVTAEPNMPLAHCAARMLDHRISALPIVEDERPLGILTQRDILLRYAALAAGPG